MTPVTGPSFELIRDVFTAVGGEPSSRGAWTTFLCPTHDDDQASAGIKYDSDEHRTVVRCFAGCPDVAVLEALGLTIGDLFDHPASSAAQRHLPTVRQRRARTVARPMRRKRHRLGKQLGWPVEIAQYVYYDRDRSRIGRVIRTRTEYEYGTKKSFYQRRYDTSTDTWPLGAFAPVLYRLPQITDAIERGHPIWVCEGEKDADRAAGLGLAATCNAMGAGSFTQAHARQLASADRVVIIADRDHPGYAHARAVRDLIRPLVGQVLILEARDGKDLSDHLDAGHSLEELEPCTALDDHEIDIGDLIELADAPSVMNPDLPTAPDARLERLLARVVPSRIGPCAPASMTTVRRAQLLGQSATPATRIDLGAES